MGCLPRVLSARIKTRAKTCSGVSYAPRSPDPQAGRPSPWAAASCRRVISASRRWVGIEDHETSGRQRRRAVSDDADARCRTPGQGHRRVTYLGHQEWRNPWSSSRACGEGGCKAVGGDNIAGQGCGIRGRQRQSCPEVGGAKEGRRRGGSFRMGRDGPAPMPCHPFQARPVSTTSHVSIHPAAISRMPHSRLSSALAVHLEHGGDAAVGDGAAKPGARGLR